MSLSKVKIYSDVFQRLAVCLKNRIIHNHRPVCYTMIRNKKGIIDSLENFRVDTIQYLDNDRGNPVDSCTYMSPISVTETAKILLRKYELASQGRKLFGVVRVISPITGDSDTSSPDRVFTRMGLWFCTFCPEFFEGYLGHKKTSFKIVPRKFKWKGGDKQ